MRRLLRRASSLMRRGGLHTTPSLSCTPLPLCPAHHSLSFLPPLCRRRLAPRSPLPPLPLSSAASSPPLPAPRLPASRRHVHDTSTTRPLTGARAARTSRRCQHARCCCCRARPALPRRRMRRRAAGDVATLPHFSHTTLARARSSTPRHSHATLTPLSPPSYARRFPRRPRETWQNPPRPRPATPTDGSPAAAHASRRRRRPSRTASPSCKSWRYPRQATAGRRAPRPRSARDGGRRCSARGGRSTAGVARR